MAQGRQNCVLLAVLCGQFADRQRKKGFVGPGSYVFPELVSAGRLEVQTLVNPTIDKFCEAQKLVQPNILYLQGSQVENEEQIGSLVWGTVDMSEPEMLVSRISPPFPTIVYLELPNGEKIAQAFQSKGVPYVIYWKNGFTPYAASHFLHSLLSVVQSSCCHTWDAFQLAHASFRLYCLQNNQVLLDNTQKLRVKLVPQLLGDAPKINIPVPAKDVVEEVKEEEGSSETLPSVKIYDEDVSMRILVCGVPGTLNAFLLSSLEDGLNALLNIEIRGSKLQNRVSATPPPLEIGNLSRGVVTMRCDITTCSTAHISLLVSGSAQTCFNDQLIDCQIKHELVEKSQLVHALPNSDESKQSPVDPMNSISVACGESTFEVCLKVPTWAAQVLKQLAPEVSYRSLVTLGIASVQGTSVASFEKEDADRLHFFCRRPQANLVIEDNTIFYPPRWCSPLTKLRPTLHAESKLNTTNNITGRKGVHGLVGQNSKMEKRLIDGKTFPGFRENKLKIATMRPVPFSGKRKRLSFPGIPLSNTNGITPVSANLHVAPPVKQSVVAPVPRRSMASSLKSKPMVPANPLPLKKHGCNRPPIQVCSEEEFLRDAMQFLILRGHGRLVPQGGISEFPDVVLNAKRLDLYNLYREVVSRGGFYVGNGINWKGQVFSKMRNHTVTNRMTGVGNTLKRHYETYLLEYELAHDDVDGECCLICHSSAPGHWVNCGLCGEWAHFGCDRRQGLGTFKDYAKTDGLEYICPHCSLSDSKKKAQKIANGVTNTSSISRYA